MAEKIALVCSSNDRYAMPTAVMLYSAVSNLSPDSELEVFYLTDDVTEANRAKTHRVLDSGTRRAQITWCDPKLVGDSLHTRDYLGMTTYFRLMAPDLLPQSVHKAIYLDSDLIIRSDIAELWGHDVSDWPLMAVQDYAIPTVSSSFSGLRASYHELGVDPDADYFNSGVLLLNLDRLRKERTFDRALDYSRRYSHILQHEDQDGLNAVLAGNWGKLDPRWNLLVCIVRHEEYWVDSALKTWVRQNLQPYEKTAKIMHFCGPTKPWTAGLTNTFRKYFFQNLKRSAWFTPKQYARWRLQWNRSALAHAKDVALKPILGSRS